LTSRELRLWRPIVAPLANAAGISDAEIGEQFDNLTTFVAGQIEEAADKLSGKDD